MRKILFDCPACKQAMEAPADMAGEKVDCPSCKREVIVTPQKESAFSIGLVLIVIGGLVWTFAHFGESGMDPEKIYLTTLVGAALLAVGVALWLWKVREDLVDANGNFVLIGGLAALILCLLIGFLPGLIAAGFVSVVGAILAVVNRC